MGRGYTEISIDKLADTIEQRIVRYSKFVNECMVEITEIAMKDLVQKTKDTAPVGKRNKHYKNNITSKVLKKRRVGYGQTYREVWYVKGPDYRLSHLLNNGHALRNGDRYTGTNFIGKAYIEVSDNYLKALARVIENYGDTGG